MGARVQLLAPQKYIMNGFDEAFEFKLEEE